MTRRPLAGLTALSLTLTSAVLGTSALLAGAAAAAPPPDTPVAADPALAATLSTTAEDSPSGKISADLADADGTVTAIVQLDAPSGVEVTAEGGDPAAVQAAAEDTEDLAADVVPSELSDATAGAAAPQRIATLTNLVAGTLVTGDAAKIRELAGSDDVVALYRVTSKTLENSHTVSFTKALQAWQDTGHTGEGVRIGIIDTGLDYTHADFGGPGTVEAYAEAYGTDGAGPVPAELTDPAKFIGGYDFAGPLYDADPASKLPGATTVPTPDENPIDASYLSDNSGHGSHVAGTAAGYGVDATGKTFTGDYSALTDVSDWTVGPGTAPQAELYSLKVFGDIGGSTDLTSLALDRAADPNGDGDLGDRLDVVNLSLGSDGSPADDPDSQLIDTLSALGTVVVLAAGNAGDLEDIAGSPGNGVTGLAVANSVGSPQTYDGVEVTAATDPASVRTWSGQNSINYAGDADVTAPVVAIGATTFSGCTPFTAAQAAQVAGKIAYLWWDDDDSSRACGSATRWTNAQNAGAVGVLIGTTETVFAAGIAGNAGLPGAQLTGPSTTALLPEITAGTLTVHLGPSLSGAVIEDIAGDALNSGSSRGVHGSLGVAKPDVAAPGTLIVSAASSTGNEGHSLSGTSMASPHVAGIAALVRSAHPGWGQVEVKAAVVNTATHDVTTEGLGKGETYGPARVGAGRVDALAAVTTPVVAYNSQVPAQTSVAFGVVNVGASTVKATKTVTVKNLGDSPVTYATSVTTATTAGGATITASPANVTVPAGGQSLVTLTLTADPTTLAREIDPTQDVTQAGLPREYVTQLSGRLVLTSGSSELRVPVQAAPRLVSDLKAGAVSFADAGAPTATLPLSGRGVADGGWYSLSTPLILAATSPKLETAPGFVTSASATAAGDLRYVGWVSTAPQEVAAGGEATDGYLGIGVATDGEWATLGHSTQPVADIDIDGDGTADIESYVTKYAESDITVALTVDLATGATLDIEPVNLFFGDVESGIFDNNVVVLPIALGAVGIEPGDTPTVQVSTYSQYAQDPSGILDSVEPFTIDPFDPTFWFENDITGSFSSLGADGTAVPVHHAAGVTSGQLLVLQHQNAATTSRAQVVDVTVPEAVTTTTTLKVTGGGKAGQAVTLAASVAPRDAQGTVTFLDGTTEIASAAVTNGKATAKAALGAGTHQLTAVYAPATGAWKASTSKPVKVTVARSGSSTKLVISPKQVHKGTAATATVTVTGQTTAPTGTVEIREGHKVLASGTLTVNGSTGTVTITLPTTLTVGTHQLTAVYVGSTDVNGSKSSASLRVVR
ncbi:S8 family serine peptidase [Cellulomonas soli]|uniref:Peptidase S8 n=1 Tax=Cellulomonas soli TaxID=931535 RepID=A0A512PF47_9CELL|nr:S8 family serine peptidase [Cellulomonas soli]NYI59379.1 subtilisin family serine protease [Cellulomonas soli]GEP69831.1 peptidase S8 [Cellulomonas soli]